MRLNRDRFYVGVILEIKIFPISKLSNEEEIKINHLNSKLSIRAYRIAQLIERQFNGR